MAYNNKLTAATGEDHILALLKLCKLLKTCLA